MACCCPISDRAPEDRMKLQHRSSPGEPSGGADDDDAQAGGAATAIAAATAAQVTASAATMPQLPPASVKMAGYLDKRGKRLPTWKRYWFVLDGRLLLYFRSQFDYLQLSPCRGSLNLGLVSGVRPAGSRAAPQLELITRSQTVLLRTKERDVQERWLKALLDAMQLHSPKSTDSQSHFRYTSASLPQASRRKKGANKEMEEEFKENDEDDEEEEGVATDRVLQRIKHIGNQSYGTLADEIRTVGTGSLRHVTPRSAPHSSGGPTHKVAELTAQLPTNKAVLRLLERRQQEEEEQQHVTTIVVDPAENKPSVEGEATKLDIIAETEDTKTTDTAEKVALTDVAEEAKPNGKESHETKLPEEDIKSSNSSLKIDVEGKKSEVAEGILVENDVYVASPAIVKEDKEDKENGYEELPASMETSATGKEEEEDMYEAVPPLLPPMKSEDGDYATVEAKDTTAYEPSLPPRPIQEIKHEETKNKKKGKNSKTSESAPASNAVQRKRSFLQRMLGSNKNKKTVNNKNIPIIKVDEYNDDDYDKDDYETVDYEELLRNRQAEQLLLNESAKAEDAVINASDSIQPNESKTVTVEKSSEIQSNIKQPQTNEYVNVNTMMNTPAIKNDSDENTDLIKKSVTKTVQETNSNIVPIIENEKTHTVTITVHDNRETIEATTPVVSVDEVKPKLPPRRSSSSGSLGTPQPRPVSPWHDVPTNNAPVIAKSKRRSSELLCTTMPMDLVTDLENEDCDIHKTIINIAGNNDQVVQTTIETKINKIPEEKEEIKNKIIVEEIQKSSLLLQESQPNLINNEIANQSVDNKSLANESGESCESCTLRSQISLTKDETQMLGQLQDNRCTHKHHSADELDILLRQLTQITYTPLHSASVDALEPLRTNRLKHLDSDPDYDVPRPHHLYLSLMPQETVDPQKQSEDIMEATRFFTEPDLYYARPLSEYLQELDQMSSIQHKRTTRASKAFQKWIEDSQDIFPSMGNLYNDDDHDVKKISTPNNSITEEIIDEDSCLFLNTESEENLNKDDISTNIDTTKQVVELGDIKEEIKEIIPLEEAKVQKAPESKDILSPGSTEKIADNLCPQEEVKELNHEHKEVESNGNEQVSANINNADINPTNVDNQVSSELETCETKECCGETNQETGEVCCVVTSSEIERKSSDCTTAETENIEEQATSVMTETTEENVQRMTQIDDKKASIEDKELDIKVADIIECTDDTLTNDIDILKVEDNDSIKAPELAITDKNDSVVSSSNKEISLETNGHADEKSCILSQESEEKPCDDEKNLSDKQQALKSPEISSAETGSDTDSESCDGVVMRNKTTLAQNAVRLSFAMAESMVIEEETVNIMNTPQHSPSFTFSPQ